jgi:transposase
MYFEMPYNHGMNSRHGSVHVATIIRRYKGKVYKTHLLRRTYRQGQKVLHETLGNLTRLPEATIDLIRRSLKGERFVSTEDAFRTIRSLPHGHVEAILRMIGKLGVDAILASKPCRPRDLVLAMIVQRILFPCSKLATTRDWHTTTLAEELGVADADEDDLYAALDWLLGRQAAIETKLARRHLAEGGVVLYDVSSSYYEGRTCPLAQYGHNRDGKKGRPIIVYGLLTDGEGRPVAVEGYPGNTGDPTTVPGQVEKLRERFGLKRVVLAGDRGMLTQTQIDHLKEHPGLGWISCLRSEAIRRLIADGHLPRSLFDQTNLAEIRSPEFPGERLMACYNPLLAEERARKRQELLAATEKGLTKLAAQVARRTKRPMRKTQIALKAGQLLGRYKVSKHFAVVIEEGTFRFSRNEASIEAESQRDGIYVVRTSEPRRHLPAADAVRDYKRLTEVEQAFRCLKSPDLRIRPIYHRLADRVRAHLLLCMLAYYVQWHLKQAWKTLLFEEEQMETLRRQRDPVAKAEPSTAVQRKKATHQTAQGLPVQSFTTLLRELGKRCRNTCQVVSDPGDGTFEQLTELTPLQAEALRLIDL